MSDFNWLSPPFNFIITGITNCGKTYYVLDLIETTFKNKFDYIIIFCPTFHVNKTYNRRWLYKDPGVIIAPSHVNLDILLGAYTEAYGRTEDQILFLIDDCANEKSAKVKSSALTKLAFSGRHLGVSVWVITQKYNAIIKDFRDNLRHLCLFYEKDEESLKTALSENSIISKDQRGYIIEALKHNKAKLLLRLEHPYDYTVI